jgi:hypothetical protein
VYVKRRRRSCLQVGVEEEKYATALGFELWREKKKKGVWRGDPQSEKRQ